LNKKYKSKKKLSLLFHYYYGDFSNQSFLHYNGDFTSISLRGIRQYKDKSIFTKERLTYLGKKYNSQLEDMKISCQK